uniref:Putative secreted protein n=1 Tax=Anopheles darlingi TaxID=43151 RepID=A0A2M4DHK9_ANODA
MRLLVVVVLAIAGFVTVIGSSRDVGTFGLLGTPITAANVSSRFVVVGVIVVGADADAIDDVGSFGVFGSLMEAPDVPLSFPVTIAPATTVADDDDASDCCLLIRSKFAKLLPLGSRPFFDGTSTVDIIGGFVRIAFVSIVVLG